MGVPTRATKGLTVEIAAGEAESTAINLTEYAAGLVLMPAAWTAADLGVKVCGSEDGTFVPLKDTSNAYGTDVSIDGPVASAAYPLPAWVFAAQYIKLWSHDGSGNGVNQDSARTLTVFLKA